MVSERQLQANQLNAKSGGVKTPEGKAIAAQNAIKHGATSTAILLPGEDANEFDALSEQLWDHFIPQGPLEELLLKRVASLMWRLHRCERAERGMLVRRHYTQREIEARAEAAQYIRIDDILDTQNLGKTITILNKSGFAKAEKEAGQMKQLQTGHDAFPGVSFHAEQEGLLNLSRYETGIERSLFRALHELERYQAIRKGLSVSPPVVVSVDGLSEADSSLKGV